MKKISIIFILLLGLFLPQLVKAYNVPTPTSFVMDQANKLTQFEVEKLNNKINAIKANTKNQFGVLIIPNLAGETIEDVAYQTFNSWKIGDKRFDNGILIVFSIAERKARIEVGRGLGGELTDLESNEVLRNNIVPYLKQNNFYEAIDSGINAITSKLENRTIASKNQSSKSGSTEVFAIVFGILIVVTGFTLLMVERKRRKKLNDFLCRDNVSYKNKLTYKTIQQPVKSPLAIESTYVNSNGSVTKYRKYSQEEKEEKEERWRVSYVPSTYVAAAATTKETKKTEEVKPTYVPHKTSYSSSSGYSPSKSKPSSYRSHYTPSYTSYDSGSSYSGSSYSSYDGGSSGGGGSSSDW